MFPLTDYWGTINNYFIRRKHLTLRHFFSFFQTVKNCIVNAKHNATQIWPTLQPSAPQCSPARAGRHGKVSQWIYCQARLLLQACYHLNMAASFCFKQINTAGNVLLCWKQAQHEHSFPLTCTKWLGVSLHTEWICPFTMGIILAKGRLTLDRLKNKNPHHHNSYFLKLHHMHLTFKL